MTPPVPTPLAEARPPRPSTWLAVASLVLNVFSGEFPLMGVPLPLDRAFLVLAVLALALEGSGGRRLVWRPVHAVLAASIAWTAASALWAGTITAKVGLFALLDRVTMPALLFVLAPFLFPTPPARQLIVRAFVVLGLYLGVTSILSITGPASWVFPRYIMDPSVGILFGRARGPFVEASANGLALAFTGFVAAAGCWLLAGRWRTAAAVAVLVCAVGSLLTYTRSVWIGVAAGVLAYCLAHPRLRRLTPLIAGSAAGLVALLLAGVPALQAAVLARFTTVRSIDDRTTTNHAALSAFDHHPLTGVGWNRFLAVVPDYVRQQDLVPLTNVNIEAHNVLLSRAAELGLPGALLWLATMATALAPVVFRAVHAPDLRELRCAFIGFLPCYAAVAMLTPLSHPFSNAVPFLVAGILLGDHQISRAPVPPSEPSGRRTRTDSSRAHAGRSHLLDA